MTDSYIAKHTNKIIFLLAAALFAYTSYRAVVLSITWDESQSYHEYIKNHIVLTNKYDFMSANNHILNTLGGIFFTKLFGVSEFTLRITSLIAHLFFLFFSAKLVLSFVRTTPFGENKWLAVSAFIILNINPYLLDFFSLSRGYSVSLGFMMASIYYLYLFHKNDFKTKDAVVSILFAALATLGNLTLLNYCLVLFGMIGILQVYNRVLLKEPFLMIIKTTLIKMALPSVLLALFLWFILPISFGLRGAGALFMGGENGLWKDTIGTIVPRLWYNLDFNYWLQRLTKAFFFIILLAAMGYVGFKHAKGQTTRTNLFLGTLVMTLLLIVLSTVVQHYLLDTLYLIERTVLFLYVLLMLIFVFLMNELSAVKKIFQTIAPVFAFLFLIHFLFAFNLKHVYEWKDDCETKEMLEDVKKLKQNPQDKFNISIGIPLALESSINYYRGVDHLTWLNEAQRSVNVNYLNDYVFLRPTEIAKTNMDSLEVIKTYPVTQNVLAKPKYPFTKGIVFFDSLLALTNTPFKIDTGLEYSPGYSIVVTEQLPTKNSILSCHIEFQQPERFTENVYYILSCQNASGMYVWRNLRLNDFCLDKNEATMANFTTFIPEETKVGDEIKIYLWNPGKQQLSISKMQLKWIHYSH